MNQILVLLLSFLLLMLPPVGGAVDPGPAGSPAPAAGGPARRPVEFVDAATTSSGWMPGAAFRVRMPEHRAGDLLLAFISSGYGHAGDPPAGWTLVRQDVKTPDDLAVQTYRRIAGAREPDAYAWPIVGAVNAGWKALGAATVLAFRNVDPERPVAQAAVAAQTPDSRRIDCPSVMVPEGGMLVCGWALDDPDTVTAPDGMTQVSDVTIRNDDSHAVAYAPASGRTGVRSAGINDVEGGSDDFAHAVALRPAPAAGRDSPPGVP